MSDLWDGETLADWIGQELTNGEQGYFPHGIGVPFAAVRAVCAYLRDFEVANAIATRESMDLNTAGDLLAAIADHIEGDHR
jgi:hypothetical protein